MKCMCMYKIYWNKTHGMVRQDTKSSIQSGPNKVNSGFSGVKVEKVPYFVLGLGYALDLS